MDGHLTWAAISQYRVQMMNSGSVHLILASFCFPRSPPIKLIKGTGIIIK